MVLTYKQKLIKFMQAKQKLIENNGIKTSYFSKEDEIELLTWKEKDCTHTYNLIQRYIGGFGGLSSDFCPWCIINSDEDLKLDCNSCKYGIRNGYCFIRGSTFHKLMLEIEATEERLGYTLFNTRFYCTTIKEIENASDSKKDK